MYDLIEPLKQHALNHLHGKQQYEALQDIKHLEGLLNITLYEDEDDV